MFDNPGEKIKKVAMIFFVLTVIGGLIGGILSAVAAGSFWSFLLVLLSALASGYLGALGLYGFGTLIDSNEEIAENTRDILSALRRGDLSGKTSDKSDLPAANEQRTRPLQRPSTAPQYNPNASWICECGTVNANYVSTCSCGRNKREVLAARNKKE